MATSRTKLIAKLQKSYPKMMLRNSEDFDGRKDGIWTSGEDGIEDRNGMPIFDYYGEDGDYIFGVLAHLHNFLERNGWYGQWIDSGTMMLYKI